MQAEQIEINGDIFTFSTYNGLNVIVAPTGYINATNLCKQCGKDFRHYKENQEWTEIINYFEKQQPSEFRQLVGNTENRIHSLPAHLGACIETTANLRKINLVFELKIYFYLIINVQR